MGKPGRHRGRKTKGYFFRKGRGVASDGDRMAGNVPRRHPDPRAPSRRGSPQGGPRPLGKLTNNCAGSSTPTTAAPAAARRSSFGFW